MGMEDKQVRKITVGVIFGGRSVEHEVSIISALQVLHALDREKYELLPIYISKQGQWYCGEALAKLENYRNMETLLAACRKVTFSPNYNDFKLLYEFKGGFMKKPEEVQIDLAFPVMHGSHGEDGCLQGLLELSGVPFVGPAVLGSALGMDKIAMKAVLREAGLPVVDFFWFTSHAFEDAPQSVVEAVEARFAYPVIVKPANLGSSIGISKAANREKLEEALALAASFSSRLLVEPVVEPLREINISVLGDADAVSLSYAEEPLSADDILSFRDKYLSAGKTTGKGMSGASRRIPADLEPALLEQIQNHAKAAFHALDLEGVCRFDFLVNRDSGAVYINEVNTIPGSLSFYLWEPAGKSFPALLDDLIRLALKRYRRKERTIYSYASNILAQKGFKGGKK